ncbi:hypothetical protein ND748_22485 [Frankia sp. AiPs1]|uniref:hypothetical protein n=1 Tax=Frankia sp. AiPs1 TaxID=573493 RepID=UPI002043CEB7|nr:hypothetical protein [Frankia sp. AiPs1]MCM3924419.1 hypothetical protein [Frankia sp. AiPs1]
MFCQLLRLTKTWERSQGLPRSAQKLSTVAGTMIGSPLTPDSHGSPERFGGVVGGGVVGGGVVGGAVGVISR